MAATGETVRVVVVMDRPTLDAVKAATFEPKNGTAVKQALRRFLASEGRPEDGAGEAAK